MLSVLRQNANSWFMILLFAIITIVFIFTFGSWGGGDVSGDMPWAARVNGRIISQAQFQAQYSTTYNNMRAFQPGFTIEQAKQMDLKNTVLDRLVGTELLAQEADDRGLFISDKEVVDEIKRRYFRDRDFNEDDYKRVVNGIFQTNEARFESQIARELLGERLEMVLREMQQVSPTEVREIFNTRNDRVNLEVLRIEPQFWADQFTAASDEEATAWAAGHGEDIQAYYNERINRYRKPPSAQVSHIVVKLAEDAAEDVKRKAREKIDAAKTRLDSGEAFEKVAREVSEDGAADKGGDLGEMAKGESIDKAFEQVVFSLELNKVSDVVEGKNGLHLIKVRERNEGSIQKIDEVKVSIAKILMKENFGKEKGMAVAEKALADAKAGTALTDLKIEGFPDSLVERNDNRKAPRVEETKFFDRKSRFVPRVGISDELVTAAFALTDEEPLAAKVFEISKRLFIIKMKERERPDPTKFEEGRTAIENELLSSRKQQVVDALLKEVKETAEIVKNPKMLQYGNI